MSVELGLPALRQLTAAAKSIFTHPVDYEPAGRAAPLRAKPKTMQAGGYCECRARETLLMHAARIPACLPVFLMLKERGASGSDPVVGDRFCWVPSEGAVTLATTAAEEAACV